MNRRGFLQACLAAATAPYVVTASGVLMPVRKLITDPWTLTESNLEQMIIEISELTNDRGLLINVMPTMIQISDKGLVCGGAFKINEDLILECKAILDKKRPAACGYGFTTDYRRKGETW